MPARGDLYNGWITLAGDFQPSLNKESNPWDLKPFESPSGYGWHPDKPGRLAYLSACPTGTARTATTKTINATTFYWYYNRLWRASGAYLHYFAPEYDDITFRQGLGILTADAAIVTYMPVLSGDMWVATATGSQIIPNAISPSGNFVLNKMSQEMKVTSAAYATTLDSIPYSCNASGVFSFDGSKTKEWTAPVRNNLGSFASVAILANYEKKWIIGTSKFVIDTESGKLFDFGTSGFLFTTRTMKQGAGANPFTVSEVPIAFIVEHSGTAGGTITWQSKIEDEDWNDEEAVEVQYESGQFTRVEVPTNNSQRTGRKYAIRLTSLSSNIYINEIQVNVSGLAEGSFAP